MTVSVTELAAIVARDRETRQFSDVSWESTAERDRRALLALLRETREAGLLVTKAYAMGQRRRYAALDSAMPVLVAVLVALAEP